MIPVVLLIVLISFLLIHLAPGDPALVFAGPNADQAYVDQLRRELGLDQSLWVQLIDYLSKLSRGDLGQSMSYPGSVWSVIASRIPATLLLVLSSQVIGLVVGTVVGTLVARRQGSARDNVVSTIALVLYSIPVFWSGLVLILVFAVTLGILPASGMHSAFGSSGGFGGVIDTLKHLVLPVTALSLSFTIPTYLRIARASVISIEGEDFITTARSKGLNETTILFRHVLRNALLPIVTMGGMYIGLSLSGAVLTETVFSWPGIGQLTYQVIFSRDYPTLLGVFLVSSIGVVVVTLLTDMLYGAIDPRVSHR